MEREQSEFELKEKEYYKNQYELQFDKNQVLVEELSKEKYRSKKLAKGYIFIVIFICMLLVLLLLMMQ